MTSQDRRQFLKTSATIAGLGGASAVVPGCAITSEHVHGRGAGFLTADTFVGSLIDQERAVAERQMPRLAALEMGGLPADRQVKNSLNTLLWTGSFRDLDEGDRQRDDVQTCLTARTGGMARTVLTTAAYLDELPADRLARVAGELHSDPSRIAEIHDTLVLNAQEQGVRTRRLRHFTQLYDHVAWRLTHQDPAVVIGESLDKVERISRHHGVDWRRERLSWHDQQFVDGGLVRVDGSGDPEEHAPVPLSKKEKTGLALMGIGAGLAIPSVVVAAGFGMWVPFAFIATAGAVLLVIGIVMVAKEAALAPQKDDA
jgi:hypothetical protein